MQLRERLAYAGVLPRSEGSQAPRAPVPPGFSRGENRFGEVYYRDRYLPLDHRHGEVDIGAAAELDTQLLERLGEGLTAAHIRGAAFLDIETTGLSGGTGTYAFLIGVGTFESLAFRVRQFVLGDPRGEAAMLCALSETIDRCAALVTFNGKTFDLPQLSTRYALNRLAPPADLPHIDLLHPARRLFGRRLQSCRLSEIERGLLGLRRQDDLPSWMIPGLYFAYVRGGHVDGLNPVFQHNLLDVVSLAAFVAYLNGVAGRAPGEDAHGALALARWDESRGRYAEAMRLYEEAWDRDPDGDVGGEAVSRLARLVRWSGDWRRCEALWTEEEKRTGSVRRALRARVELAKLAEHRLRDVGKALEYTREAIELLAVNPQVARTLPETSAALAHRLRRLERRIFARLSGQHRRTGRAAVTGSLSSPRPGDSIPSTGRVLEPTP